jgi:hypothetical protein
MKETATIESNDTEMKSSRKLLHMACLILIILMVFQFFLLQHVTDDSLGSLDRSYAPQTPSISYNGQCALLFFGLPRAYKEMVLPSIKRYLLEPNERHHCDFYVHYFHKTMESAGRRNRGGTMDPREILSLEGAARNVSSSSSDKNYDAPLLVEFASDTDESFQEQYASTLQKYHSTLGKDGKPAYFPYQAHWQRSSLDNMVKQWHSIQSVFQLMEATSKKYNKTYDRVGMFRSDVMYMTPIDISRLDLGVTDTYNQYAVVPSFSQYPVNDRMIYGPTQAVRVWATQRFQLIEDRVKQASDPGYEMHSEKFMVSHVFPTIENQSNSMSIHLNQDICFARTRADYSVMVGDCRKRGTTRGWKHVNAKNLVESIVRRPCKQFRDNDNDEIVGCGIGMEHLYQTEYWSIFKRRFQGLLTKHFKFPKMEG